MRGKRRPAIIFQRFREAGGFGVVGNEDAAYFQPFAGGKEGHM